MKRNKGIMAPMQVGIEDFKGVFQDRIRTMVRQGILDIIAQEVTDLCGESHLPSSGIYSRAGTEPVTITTSSGKVLKYVKERNFAAFEALSARRDVILAFHRLNVPATLNVTFLSTNHIENVMGNARGTIGRVCRWHDDTNQVARWMAVALLRAQSGFRRVRGHEQLAELAAALVRP
jgi:hypothetical protein